MRNIIFFKFNNFYFICGFFNLFELNHYWPSHQSIIGLLRFSVSDYCLFIYTQHTAAVAVGVRQQTTATVPWVRYLITRHDYFIAY